MGVSVTVSTTSELVLKPAVKSKLLRELRLYEKAKLALKDAEALAEKHKAAVAGIREEIGEQTVKVDGFTVTLVAGTKSKLDKGKLIAQGVTTAQIEMATVVTPSKAYTLITLPGKDE